MNITKALKIPGWMFQQELIWLAEQAAKHQQIVEIGSYLGRSTRALADNTVGNVYAVDDWYGPRDVWLPDEARSKLFDAFQANMDGLQGKLHVVKADYDSLPELSIRPDMVFIDGDHKSPSIRRDLHYWIPRLSPGGLLCGHDYFEPGVFSAVHDLVPTAQWAGTGTLIWYAEKPAKPGAIAQHARIDEHSNISDWYSV